MKEAEKILGHRFKDKTLLDKALTHSSVNSHVAENYERLEFLGDRVLGVSVASLLFRLFPHEPEGNLSRRFTGLVCKETVAQVARMLGLEKYIRVGSEDIRDNENVLCDVCEAVIGAIYIDAGVDEAIAFVDKHWRELIDKNMAPPKDAKTLLQEVAHVKGLGVPEYRLVSREGSEHEPVFHIAVTLPDLGSETGARRKKKLAEFDAAGKMLERLTNG